jgi:hypothetical protein
VYLPVKQPDAPETPPELFRLTYFEAPDGRFFIESASLETYLRETCEGLEKQAEAKALEGDELSAAGLWGASHILGTIADQVTLLPLQHDATGGEE